MMDRFVQQRVGRREALRRGALGISAAGFGMSGAARLGPASAQEATPTATGDGNPPGITPERVEAAIGRLDHLVQQTLDETGIPGIAVAVVYGDEMPYAKGFGVRDAGQDQPVDTETVFQLASVSKSIASSVVAAVVGDGDCTWDSPIVEYFTDFQMHVPWVTSQVTLRDMFCHRSGLPDHAGDLLEDLGFDREEVLYRLRFVEPKSSFRSEYAYTNFGLTAAGVAAAIAAGTDWEDLAERRIFQPLGMSHSSYRFADFIAQPNHAVGHMMIDGAWTAHEQRQPDPEAPAGGASSNVIDMARWMRMELGAGVFEGEQIVTTDPLNQTHIPQIVNNPPQNPAVDRAGFYGLGFNVGYTDAGHVRLGHSGAFNLGAATTFYLYPGAGLGIVVLTNAQPIGAAETLALEFADLAEFGTIRQDYRTLLAGVFAAMNVPPYGTEVDYLTPPADATAPLPVAAYAGTYANTLYGPMVIAEEADGLVLQIGPEFTAYPLTHYDRDTYWFQPPGENAYGPSGVTFEIGPTGTAATVTIEYLDVTHQGTFVRSEQEA